ncbi:transposase [Micromonospora sp. KC606]|uniref:transposase n=1 Tax=Micromonospora sp. KC606 TaxID=2530379 RepID=UPI001FB7E926|nr:transposase [Micromonospora sp. KC606]
MARSATTPSTATSSRSRRWPQIHAFLTTGVTNAGSEGANRLTKTIARDADGFRNPENQRLRTRTVTTGRRGRHLSPA